MRRRSLSSAPLGLMLCMLLSLVACVHNPNLQTPEGQRAQKAREIVQRLGEGQNLVIELNRMGKLDTPTSRTIVQWISGDRSQTPPVTGALDILKTFPAGWQQTLQAGWQSIRSQALASADLASWVTIVDELLTTLPA